MNILDYILVAIIILCLISALTFVIKQREKGNHVGCGNCNTCYKNCKQYKNNQNILK